MRILLLVALVAVVAGELVHFHNQQVLRYNIHNEEQKQIIRDMGLDVWSHDSEVLYGLNDIMVTPSQKSQLAKYGIHHVNVMVQDVEAHLSQEREALDSLLAQSLASFYDAYHNWGDIINYYSNLTTTHSDLVEFWSTNIGSSYENRPIAGLVITSKNGAAKKNIYIQGGQHAREWISHATVTYITEQLLTQYSTDPAVKTILDTARIVIIPIVNPDGYVYTWTTNRLWRKNRRPNAGGTYGVDLNRNWNDHWGGEGSSKTPSSDTYCGTAPFSEPESTLASKFYTLHGPYVGAIDYHSYSQLILRPYGWTTALPPNEAFAKSVGDGIRDTIRATSNVAYTSEPSWQLYYTTGTAQDWFYSEGKAPLAFTIELRDTGTYGFQLPPAQIIPTGQENWAAFKYFVNRALSGV